MQEKPSSDTQCDTNHTEFSHAQKCNRSFLIFPPSNPGSSALCAQYFFPTHHVIPRRQKKVDLENELFRTSNITVGAAHGRSFMPEGHGSATLRVWW